MLEKTLLKIASWLIYTLPNLYFISNQNIQEARKMANSEYLTLLKQDPVTWNKWRHANPSIKPDLHGADLSRTDLHGADLVEANLSGADLSGADLGRSNFSGANLSGTNLYEAKMRGRLFGESTRGRSSRREPQWDEGTSCRSG